MRFLMALCVVSSLWASQPLVHSLSGFQSLSMGASFEGTMLTRNGRVKLGYQMEKLTSSLPGSISAVARSSDGVLYVATSSPAKVWQIKKEPVVVFESDKTFVTALTFMANGELAIVTAPEGGVHFVKPGAWGKAVYVEIPHVNQLLSADAEADVLYLVGGGETGALLAVDCATKKVDVLAHVNESSLRTIFVQPGKGTASIYLGGGEQGVVYHYQNGLMSSIYSAGPSEITSFVSDKKGRLFASFLTSGDNPSSGVVRIDVDGGVTELWSSSHHVIYALAIDDAGKKLYLATGSNGLLLSVDIEGKSGVDVVLSQFEHRDIMTLLWAKSGELLVGAANQSALYRLDLNREVNSGSYLSPVFDMDSLSSVGNVMINASVSDDKMSFRVGNTPVVDETWTKWGKSRLARYAQVKVNMTSTNAPIDEIRLSYLPVNRAPKIQAIRILPIGHDLTEQLVEPQTSAAITLDEKSFSDMAKVHYFAPVSPVNVPGQIKEKSGFRTIYVSAEDPDTDALRYKYTLARIGKNGQTTSLYVVKDWSSEPFVSFDAFKAADGRYQIKVNIDDLLTNGPKRVLGAEDLSATFLIANALPVLSNTSLKVMSDSVRVQLTAEAKVPLAMARCSLDGKHWIPVDPKDGITDSMREVYDVILPGKPVMNSVSCEVLDVVDNRNRIDLHLTIE